jgi:hypothetical protein
MRIQKHTKKGTQKHKSTYIYIHIHIHTEEYTNVQKMRTQQHKIHNNSYMYT